MGQAESGLKGTYTFAYIANATQSYYSTQSPNSVDETTKKDLLFSNPEVYGLTSQLCFSSASTASSIKVHERPDSGYMSPAYDEKMQILNDLAYIDNAYYPLTRKSTDSVCRDNDAYNDITREEPRVSQISFTDAMLASPDKTLHEVYLSLRSIHRLSPNIGMLTMIRKLDLSNNQLTGIPDSIGHMKNLQVLSVAKNHITAIPDTIGYLSSLSELDLSCNKITRLTSCVGYLNKLTTLLLAFNQISQLPTDISGLVNLITIDLTQNPLRVLPAEISKLPFLRRMLVDDCPFQENICYPLNHNAPSLVEICARTVVRQQLNIVKNTILPDHMITYIKSAKSCTSCHGPYYESHVLRGRLMEKTDIHIPLEYTLCSAHWSDADDRILSMFSAQPETSRCVERLPYRPSLPSLPYKPLEKTTMLSSCSRNLNPPPQIDSNVSVDTAIMEDTQQPAATAKSKKKNRKSTFSKLSSRLK